MVCFNCNQKATTKLSIEPDFGEIYTCSSQTCKDKAQLDIEQFESIKYYQGRKKDRVEFAERAVACALIGIIIVICFMSIASIINKL